MSANTSDLHTYHRPPARAALSIPEAAAVAGKSASWIRTLRTFGPLVPAILPDGRQAVTEESLQTLLAARKQKPRIRRQPKRPHLRLVINNDL
jgi:hypothetical protein